MSKRKTDGEWGEMTDICAVIKGIPEGAYLVPYAERVKAIVIEALAQEAESHHRDWMALNPTAPYDNGETLPLTHVEDDPWYSGNSGWMVAGWLRSHLPEVAT